MTYSAGQNWPKDTLNFCPESRWSYERQKRYGFPGFRVMIPQKCIPGPKTLKKRLENLFHSPSDGNLPLIKFGYFASVACSRQIDFLMTRQDL